MSEILEILINKTKDYSKLYYPFSPVYIPKFKPRNVPLNVIFISLWYLLTFDPYCTSEK